MASPFYRGLSAPVTALQRLGAVAHGRRLSAVAGLASLRGRQSAQPRPAPRACGGPALHSSRFLGQLL